MVRRVILPLFILGFALISVPRVHAESEDDYWLSESPSNDAASSKTDAKTSGDSSGLPVLEESEPKSDKSLVLKLMVVNPSTKYKQTYPLKAYLPEEVKDTHILDKEDLEIGYDSEKKSFYVQKEVELEPGQSVVKAVRVRDIWFIPEEKLNALSDEAHDVFSKLQGTEYSEQGRLLMNNIEVLLMQILERQTDKNLTPNEHIAVYRENKRKVFDIEMDLMSMRRFLSAAGEGLVGNSKSKTGSLPGFFSKIAAASKNGMVPSYILWRIIFMILIFLGLLTLLIVLVFQHQVRLSFSRRKLIEAVKKIAVKDKEKDKDREKKNDMRISEFYPGLNEIRSQKKDEGNAA